MSIYKETTKGEKSENKKRERINFFKLKLNKRQQKKGAEGKDELKAFKARNRYVLPLLLYYRKSSKTIIRQRLSVNNVYTGGAREQPVEDPE